MYSFEPITITDAMLTSSDVPETDYTAYNASTAYTPGQYCMVADSGIHKNYQCLVGCTGYYPPDNTTGTTPKWLEVGPTNRWAVFDNKVGTQSSQATSMNFVVAPGEVIDSIALMNLDASEVSIVGTVAGVGTVFSETISLITTINVIDAYTYFFNPILRSTDMVRTDIAETAIPPYSTISLSITITNTGGTAKCGAILLGLKTDVGALNYQPEVGINDYSVKTVDAWGNYSYTVGSYAKTLSGETTIKPAWADEVNRFMASIRAIPCVWIGDGDYSMLIVYGKYDSYKVRPGDGFFKMSFKLDGLI